MRRMKSSPPTQTIRGRCGNLFLSPLSSLSNSGLRRVLFEEECLRLRLGLENAKDWTGINHGWLV